MEAVHSSETLVTTYESNPEDDDEKLHIISSVTRFGMGQKVIYVNVGRTE